MEYEIAFGGGERLRVSRLRLGASVSAGARVGDEVGVSIVDAATCRVYPRDRRPPFA